MAIVKYDLIPNDSGMPAANFTDEQGRSTMLFGPAASSAMQSVDKRNQALGVLGTRAAGQDVPEPPKEPDQRLADNSDVMSSSQPEENMSRADVGPNMSVAPKNPPPADGTIEKIPGGGARVSLAAAKAGTMKAPEAPAGEGGTPPSAPAPSPGGGPRILGQKPNGETTYMDADGQIKVMTPGTKGRAGLDLYDKDYLARRDTLQEQERAAVQAKIEADASNAADNVIMAKANQSAAQQYVADQQAEVARQQAEAAKLTADSDKAANDYYNSKVDPDRLTKGNWGLALATAFGTLGQGLAATGHVSIPNTAFAIVQNRIQNDINSQIKDIDIKRDRSQTALSVLQKKTGSLDLAKATLRVSMLEQAQKANAVLMAQQGVRSTAANNQELAIKLDQSINEAREQQRQAAMMFTLKTRVQGKAATNRVASIEEKKAVTGLGIEEKNLAAPPKDERSEATQKLAQVGGQLDVARKVANQYGDDEVPPAAENLGLGSRIAAGAQNLWSGAGSYERDLAPEQKQALQDAKLLDEQITAMSSVLSQQGAMAGKEKEAALGALSPGATFGEKKRAIEILSARVNAAKAAK